tara:strand:- start:1080 stop:2708 length:1629 start_codon:yes stop_codon:yes gene_type:complete
MKNLKKTAIALLVATVLSGCGGGEEETSTGGSGGSGNTVQNVNVGFNRASFDIKEGDAGNTQVKLTFQTNVILNNPLKISYVSENGTAKEGSDYTGGTGEVTIPKGSRSADVTLNVIGNTVHQSNRDFKVLISSTEGEKMTVTKGTDSQTIRMLDDDPEPVVTFSSDVLTVHEDIGTIEVPLELDRQSEKETTVRVTLSGLTTRDVDYTVTGTDIVFGALVTSGNYPIKIQSDDLVEGTEDITVTMSTVVNGKLGTEKSMKVLITGDLKLPDTGYTNFYNQGEFNASAPDSEHPYQDGHYGLDKEPMHSGNGYASFVYQKIDNAGNPMSANATDHSCVYDQHTGLTWEIKAGIRELPADKLGDDDNTNNKDEKIAYGNQYWGSKRNQYLWNNPDSKTNGGQTGGILDSEWDGYTGPHHLSANCVFPSRNEPLYVNVTNTGCTSNKFIELHNKAARCGFKDWRLPTILELATIANYESSEPIVDPQYFRDMNIPWRDGMRYLSSTPVVENTASVWCWNADKKQVELCNKQQYHFIRLVRGAKL